MASGEEAELTLAEEQHEQSRENFRQVVIFELSQQRFCVNIRDASEIKRNMKLTEVPRTPEFVRGVVNVRGNIKTVLDVRAFFEMETSEQPPSRFLFVKVDQLEAGFVADEMLGVTHIEKDKVHPPPATVENVSSRWIDGVFSSDDRDRPLIILDVPEILRSERIRNL